MRACCLATNRFAQAKRVPLQWLICLVLWQTGTPASHAERLGALQSVTALELQQHVETLADDTFEGREAGSRGGRAAAHYLQAQLAEHFEPAGPNGQFQQPFGAGYQNLLALLPGRDPQLRNQYLLVGAHYDHVGYGTRRNSRGPTGYIHNGADDNASGTSGLLELADALLLDPPRHSVLFAFWDAEEKGLLGSDHFVAHPTIPLEQIRLVVNLDMIGRLHGPLEVGGTRTMAGLREIVTEANRSIRLPIRFPWKIEPNSDHETFRQAGIPVLMFHTGLHEDYHRPSDDADKINVDGLQAITRLALRTIWAADRPGVLAPFRAASRKESSAEQQQYHRPSPPPAPRLGIRWQMDATAKPGLIVTHVVRESAAWQAGLMQGDRILAINDQPIPEVSVAQRSRWLQRQVATAERDIRVSLSRGQEPVKNLVVHLHGVPSRLGLRWRTSDAEPHAVLLTYVAPGSPASASGLQAGDRIVSVNGQPFDAENSFLALAQSLPLPATVDAERDGVVISRTLADPLNASEQ